MLVAVLIGIMISIVVGVTLIPTIMTAITAVNNTTGVNTSCATETVGEYLPGLMALISVLPYVFVAVILLGAVAWIGGQG